MRRGYTEKPCHGCGSTEPHATNSVCRECKKAITAVAGVKEHEAAFAKDAPKIFMIPGASHWLPYIRFDSTDKDDSRPLQKSFHTLAIAASSPQDGREIDYNNKRILVFHARSQDEQHWGSDAESYRLLRPSIAKAIGALYEIVRDALAHTYNEGVEHGRSLLVQLNNGEITTSDFEEQLKRRKS